MSHRVPSVDRSSDGSCSSISEDNGEMPFRSSSGVSARGRVIGPTQNPQPHAMPRVNEPSAHGEDSSHCDFMALRNLVLAHHMQDLKEVK